jgi:hypothetical protein
MLKLNSTVFGVSVQITRSGEIGTVTGFAQHKRSKAKQFYVEYTNANGESSERWLFEDELTVVIV